MVEIQEMIIQSAMKVAGRPCIASFAIAMMCAVPTNAADYQSNGAGGGDWNNPRTWSPNGVPGSTSDYDSVRILKGDTITQNTPFTHTLGHYVLEDGALHAFGLNADLAALVIDARGSWSIGQGLHTVLVIHNASQLNMRAKIVDDAERRYDDNFCELLKNAPAPLNDLPPCADAQRDFRKIHEALEHHHLTQTDVNFMRNAAEAPIRNIDDLYHEKEIRFSDPTLTDDDLAHLAYLENLRVLELTGKHLTDAGLAHLEKLASLITISMSAVPITDAGLAHLKSLNSLQNIDLQETLVTGDGLRHIARLPHLRSLDLQNTRITNDSLALLAPMAQSDAPGVSLGLGSTAITDAGLAHLKKLPRLESLDLSNTSISDEGLANLSEMTNLTFLDLRGTRITNAGLVHLKSLNHLQRLDLQETTITGPGLAQLTTLADLRSLNLTSTPINDDVMPILGRMNGIVTLQLSRTNITDAALNAIIAMPNLNFIAIDGTKVTAPGVAYLKKTRPQFLVCSDCADRPQ